MHSAMLSVRDDGDGRDATWCVLQLQASIPGPHDACRPLTYARYTAAQRSVTGAGASACAAGCHDELPGDASVRVEEEDHNSGDGHARVVGSDPSAQVRRAPIRARCRAQAAATAAGPSQMAD